MSDLKYEDISQQTDELVKSTMMRELRSMKQTNDRLIKVITCLASICFGAFLGTLRISLIK